MIPVKTQYKTYNDKFLAIVKAFKTEQHYLESCKDEILVVMDHNNFHQFIDIKSLSSSKSNKLKSYQNIIFRSITVRTKLIELLIPYFNIFSRVLKKKSSFMLKIIRFCIAYSLL